MGTASGPWGRRLFVEAVGRGALARTVARVSKRRHSKVDSLEKGHEEFCHALTMAEPEPLEIMVDGHHQSVGALLVEIMNISHVGASLGLAPNADPGDGLLDVVCVAADQRMAMLEWMRGTGQGCLPPATLRRGRRICVAGRSATLRLDDWAPTAGRGPGIITAEIDAEPLPVLIVPPDRRRASG